MVHKTPKQRGGESKEELNTRLLECVKSGDLECVKDALRAGADVNIKNRFGDTALLVAVSYRKLELVKELIKAGANVNEKKLHGIPVLIVACIEGRTTEIVKELIKAGANINSQDNYGRTALIYSSSANKLEIVKELIKAGADINLENKNGGTAMSVTDNFDIIKALIDAGADINYKDNNGNTKIYLAAMDEKYELVKSLLTLPSLDTMITYKGKTLLDLAEGNSFIPSINKLIKDILGKKDIWQGWTRADVEQMNTIFDAEGAKNYAYCPICLKYVGRADGCMYMSHDCSKMPGYYYKELYEKYKTTEGKIYWCTICGRIALGHRHYKLAAANGPKPELGTGSGDPFEIDCRKSNGGGGLPEKLARFRRLREYALELQDDIGKKTGEEAMDELVEAAWNAPLAKSKKYERMLASKEWNIKNTNFPEPPRPVNRPANNVAPNVKRPEPNASNANLQPLKLNRGTNNLYGEDDVEVIQFRHRKADGTINNHEDAKISLENFVNWLDDLTKKDFGTEPFGYCFMYPACNARLYPEEVKPFVSDELYNEYKQKFNRKFGAATGGRRQRGGGTFFVEATNATCVLPSKKGGRKTRKGKRVSKRKHVTRKI
jgi:ankyrin repeat protein